MDSGPSLGDREKPAHSSSNPSQTISAANHNKLVPFVYTLHATVGESVPLQG